MPIDPVKRVANWDEKYNLERVTAILTEKRPRMLQSVTAVTPQITALESRPSLSRSISASDARCSS
jgi:hypothetical protein